MAKEQLIPEGKSNVNLDPNFSVRKAAPAPIEQWDEVQDHIRETHRPDDRGEIEHVPCVTPRGAKFTALVYRAAQKRYESNDAYSRRLGRVQTLDDYRHPGDGWRDERGEPDDMSYFVDPRNGARKIGKDDQGNWNWPVEVQDQQTRKREIMKAWWHRDLAEYCGKPLPYLIRQEHSEELAEFRDWKKAQVKK
jgi:hypothetical protein